MAELILDAILEVVESALSESKMLGEVTLMKEPHNFRVILALSKWTYLHVSDSDESSGNPDEISAGQKALGEVDDYHVDSMLHPEFPLLPYSLTSSDMVKQEIHDVCKMEPVEVETLGECDADDSKEDVIDDITNLDIATSLDGPNSGEITRRSRKRKTRKERSSDLPLAEEHKQLARGKGRKGKEEKSAEKLAKKQAALRQKELTKSVQLAKKRALKLAKKDLSLPEKPFHCDQCMFKTHERQILKRHMIIHSSDRPFPCPTCGFRFKRKYEMKTHMKSHTDIKPFMCDKCDYKCRRKNDLRIHGLKHIDTKSFTCSLCDYAGKTRGQLKRHMETIHQESVRRFECENCDYKTMSETKYLVHTKAHEENDVRVCPICEKSVWGKKQYKEHVRGHDRSSKTYEFKCQECKARFKTSKALENHSGTHTGVKLKCRLCPSDFVMPSSLKKHFLKKHPGETLNHCKLCDFHSDSGQEFKRHLTSLVHLQIVQNN